MILEKIKKMNLKILNSLGKSNNDPKYVGINNMLKNVYEGQCQDLQLF